MGKVRFSLFSLFLLSLVGSCSGISTGTGGDELTPGSEEGSGSDDGSSDGSSGTSTGIEAGGETVPGGGAGGAGESGGGGATGAGSSDNLYEGGPIDIPVPIAKVESIDPRYVIVTLAGNQLTLRGEAGAVTNVSTSPQVWTQDSLTGEIKTTTSNADGSFATITFTYSTALPSTSVTVAGFDGTNIGTPVFLRISENLWVWILTNGSSVSRGSLAMDDNTVHMVIHVDSTGTPAPALTKRGERGTATSSYYYTIDVGGVPEIKSTGDIILDQIFVTEGEVIGKSGNNFYIPEGTGFKKLFSIGSAETIDEIDVESDDNGKQWIAVATDRALYVCDRTGSCSEIGDLDALSSPAVYQGIIALNWSKILYGDDPRFFLQVTWEEKLGSSLNASSWNYHPGEDFEEVLETWGWNWFETDNVDLTGTSSGTYVDKGLLKQGTVDNYATRYRPATWVNSCNSTLPTGYVTELEATIVETPYNTYYLLDADVTVNTKTMVTSGNYTIQKDSICYAKRTRTVYNAEIHPNMELIFFCAEDGNGNGQMYVLCENKIEEDTSGGYIGTGQTGTKGVASDSIVQLTEGEEHCTKDKNWKIDRNVPSNGDVSCNAVVIVNAADPTKPQIQYIDCNDPKIVDNGCLD